MQRTLEVEPLGTMPYEQALALQECRHREVLQGLRPDTLLLLEHPPVVTTGRNGQPGNLLLSKAALAAHGIEFSCTSRGGDVTYHGPGQLVVYPIVALQPREQDIRQYVWSLEEIVLRTVHDFGVEATRQPGLRGVWVGQEKLAAVGVRLVRWVTMHGFALNVDPDLAHFSYIVPCGLVGRGVTSLHRLLGYTPPPQAVQSAVVMHAAAVLQRQVSAACARQIHQGAQENVHA